jgi:hypothetical protein
VPTSRLTHFARGIERLDLGVLTLDDAAAFLLEATAMGKTPTEIAPEVHAIRRDAGLG